MSKVRYDVSDHVAEITMDSAPVNALSVAMIEEILSALKRADADDDVRAIVLCSALPRRFCAGLDLSVLQGESGLAVHKFLEKLYIELADVHYNLGKPCIAAVDGAARAGGVTLIQSNVIVAERKLDVRVSGDRRGHDPGDPFRASARIVGRHSAYEILFSGRAFGAQEAATLGLVSRIVPDGQVLTAAREMARMFADKPPGVMKLGHAAFMRFNDNDYRRDIGSVVESFCTIAATEESRRRASGRSSRSARRPGNRADHAIRIIILPRLRPCSRSTSACGTR